MQPATPTVPEHSQSLLLTGATGFLGHYLLRDLLQHGFSIRALVRQPIEQSRERLCRSMAKLGYPIELDLKTGQIVLIEGDLLATGWHDAVGPVDAVVHAAASTGFNASDDGEPNRSNVRGTSKLTHWMGDHGIDTLHLIGTAYTCGKSNGIVRERLETNQPPFHNAYEESKWRAEQIADAWSQQTGGMLTVHRPAIIVGDSVTGRTTRFAGFYVTVRASQFVAKLAKQRFGSNTIDIRVNGDESGCLNLVPVDYVSSLISHIIADPQWHGRVYNIVHPEPLSNGTMRDLIESHYGIKGSRFVSSAPNAEELTDFERAFTTIQQPVERYISDTPEFDRHNAHEVEQAVGLTVPLVDKTLILRLIRFAEEVRWGRIEESPTENHANIDHYFRDFLPRNIAQSTVAEMYELTTSVRFIIGGSREDQWVCRFEAGLLLHVHRGPNGIREDFSYCTDARSFWDVASGRSHPQSLFLTGRAEIVGDHEKALKMAMVLHEFAREYPYPDTPER